MPKAAARSTLARQWELLKNLPSRAPGATAAELTDRIREAGLASTKRTIERDLTMLEPIFGLRCNDKSVPFGWYWASSPESRFLTLSLAESLSLVLAEQYLTKVAPSPVLRALQSRFKHAKERLRSSTGVYRNWDDRVRHVPATLPFAPPRVNPQTFEVVQEALAQERQIKAQYTGMDDSKPRDLTLHPLALVQQDATTYLVATAFGYEDSRLYAVHRIQRAEIIGLKAKRPQGFSLDAFLEKGGMQFGGRRRIRLEALVSARLGMYLAESPLSTDQRLSPVNRETYRLTATAKDSWQLQFWILSQGGQIVVLGPRALRGRIHSLLEAALAKYCGRSSQLPKRQRHRST